MRDGPGLLFMRPHDVALADPAGAAVTGLAVAVRRAGPTRRLEVAVGPERKVVEIELPPGRAVALGGRVGLRIGAATLFTPDGGSLRLRPERAAPASLEGRELLDRAVG